MSFLCLFPFHCCGCSCNFLVVDAKSCIFAKILSSKIINYYYFLVYAGGGGGGGGDWLINRFSSKATFFS